GSLPETAFRGSPHREGFPEIGPNSSPKWGARSGRRGRPPLSTTCSAFSVGSRRACGASKRPPVRSDRGALSRLRLRADGSSLHAMGGARGQVAVGRRVGERYSSVTGARRSVLLSRV